MESLKRVAIVIGAMFVVIGGWQMLKEGVTNSYAHLQTRANNTESYMGVTKQMYLDKASNNGTDPAAVCVYDKLITENGIEETYKMDKRALADETDIDQRIFDAIEVCS